MNLLLEDRNNLKRVYEVGIYIHHLAATGFFCNSHSSPLSKQQAKILKIAFSSVEIPHIKRMKVGQNIAMSRDLRNGNPKLVDITVRECYAKPILRT